MKKVIIIGAGPAGLTAGYELLKKSKDIEITILEETAEIGGISRTVRYNGNRMDIGGHRFFSKSEDVMKFWREILPFQSGPSFDDKILGRDVLLDKDGNDPEKEDRVFLVRRRVSRIYYLKKFFDYPISLKVQTFANIGLGGTCRAGFSYIASTIKKRKENSLEDFYVNRFGKTLYSMFFEKYTEKLWGRHPSEISASWGAQRVKGLSVSKVLGDAIKKIFGIKGGKKETSLIEQFYYPKFGPGQLWENVAKEIVKMGGKVIINAKVTEIKTKGNRVSGIVAGGQFYEGDIIISSMPIKDLVRAIDEKPEEVQEIAEGLPYRDFVTVGLLLKKLNLKNETDMKTLNNIVPDCWIYMQEPEVKLGRIQLFNNWSPYMVANPMENVWVGLEYFCSEGDDFWNKTDDELKQFAIDELVKINIIEKGDVLDGHVEHVKKAYPAYFDTYDQIDKVIDFLNTFDNLYCVGRNGQHRYNNMDHSMLTSMLAAKHILGEDVDKKVIWEVNAEEEYHEEKKQS